jgi:hypothetical protein
MKKIYTLLIVFTGILVLTSATQSQTYKLQEGFENADSITLPTGWTVVNAGNYYTDPFWNWTVRDTGVSLPGLATALSVAHSGSKACGVSWWVSYDTNGTQYLPSAWLITKKIDNIQSGDKLKFWATGGTTNYLDSIQVLLSATDSLPSSFIFEIARIIWPRNSTYGHFTQYIYDLSPYAGNSIYIAFHYDTDCTTEGFFVHVDDVEVSNPIGVQNIGSEVPRTFAMRQNYPNPFNPSTHIEFDLPKAEYVNLVLYNTLGQEVKILLNENKQAGSYRVDFNASSLPSGTYFYRINAGDFVQTNKMVLVK